MPERRLQEERKIGKRKGKLQEKIDHELMDGRKKERERGREGEGKQWREIRKRRLESFLGICHDVM